MPASINYDEKITIDGGYNNGGCDCKHHHYHQDGTSECRQWRCKRRNKKLEKWNQGDTPPRSQKKESPPKKREIKDIKDWDKCTLTEKNKPCLPFIKLNKCPSTSWRELHKRDVENCPERDMTQFKEICILL